MHRTLPKWTFPIVVAATLGVAGIASAANPQLKLDHIPEQAVGAVFGFPQQLAAKPEMEFFPSEVIAAAGKRDFGFNPLDIEQAIGFVLPPIGGSPPSWGVVLHFAKPQKLSEDLTRHSETRDVEDVKYFAAQRPGDPSFCVYKEKTILIAPEAVLTLMIANQPADSDLRTLLSKTAVNSDVTALLAVDPIRGLANQLLVGAPPLPPPLQALLTLPDHLDSVHVGLDIAAPNATFIKMTGRDEASAEEIEEILAGALAFVKEMILQQATMAMRVQEGAVGEATLAYLQRVGGLVETRLQPVRKGTEVTIDVELNPGYASTSVLAAMLLPAVQQAREAARRTQARNSLKQIGLAMHNYHDVNRAFPAHANYEDKKPLLSWRVHVLPYIDQANLYQKFHLDEPWDSEHNKALIKEMPEVYKNPNMKADEFKTNYLAVTGEDAAFFGEFGTPIRDITDGTSNTILVVEGDEDQAVIWTKPDDWEFDVKNPLDGVGKFREGGFFALLADGSVRFISNNIDLDTLRALITFSGGEVIGAF